MLGYKNRVGRIGISEGDDLNALAENFAKVYRLNGEMKEKVRELLDMKYEEYLQAELSDQ